MVRRRRILIDRLHTHGMLVRRARRRGGWWRRARSGRRCVGGLCVAACVGGAPTTVAAGGFSLRNPSGHAPKPRTYRLRRRRGGECDVPGVRVHARGAPPPLIISYVCCRCCCCRCWVAGVRRPWGGCVCASLPSMAISSCVLISSLGLEIGGLSRGGLRAKLRTCDLSAAYACKGLDVTRCEIREGDPVTVSWQGARVREVRECGKCACNPGSLV